MASRWSSRTVGSRTSSLIARTAECLGIASLAVYTPSKVMAKRHAAGGGPHARAGRPSSPSPSSRSARRRPARCRPRRAGGGSRTFSKRATTAACAPFGSWDECCEALRATGCELMATTPEGDGAVALRRRRSWACQDRSLWRRAVGLSERALACSDRRNRRAASRADAVTQRGDVRCHRPRRDAATEGGVQLTSRSVRTARGSSAAGDPVACGRACR